jgi:hypothetical protein
LELLVVVVEHHIILSIIESQSKNEVVVVVVVVKSKEEKMLENEIKLKKQRGSEENSGGQLNQTKPNQHIYSIYIYLLTTFSR